MRADLDAIGSALRAGGDGLADSVRALIGVLVEPTNQTNRRAARTLLVKSKLPKSLVVATCLDRLGLAADSEPLPSPPPLSVLVTLLVDVSYTRDLLLTPELNRVLAMSLVACERELTAFAKSLAALHSGATQAYTLHSAGADAALELLVGVLQRPVARGVAAAPVEHGALKPIERACRAILRTRELDKVMHTQAAIVCVLLAPAAAPLVLRSSAFGATPFADSLPPIPRLALYRGVLAAAMHRGGNASASLLCSLFELITDAAFSTSPRAPVRWSALVTLHSWTAKAAQIVRGVDDATARGAILAAAQLATDATLAAWSSQEKKIASLCAPLFRSIIKLYAAASGRGKRAGALRRVEECGAAVAWEHALATRLLDLPSIDRAKSLALNLLLNYSPLTVSDLTTRAPTLVDSLLRAAPASMSVASPASALISNMIERIVKAGGRTTKALPPAWLALLATQLVSTTAAERRAAALYTLPAFLEATVAAGGEAQDELLRLLFSEADAAAPRSRLRWAALSVARWKPKRPSPKGKATKVGHTATGHAYVDELLHSLLDSDEEIRAAAFGWVCEAGNRDRPVAVNVADLERLPAIRNFLHAGGAMSQTPEFRQLYTRSARTLLSQIRRHDREHASAMSGGQNSGDSGVTKRRRVGGDDSTARADFMQWMSLWLPHQLRPGCSRWRVVVAIDLWSACQATWPTGSLAIAPLSDATSTRILLEQLMATTWEADRRHVFQLLLGVSANTLLATFDGAAIAHPGATPNLIACALGALTSKRATACDAGAMLLILLLRTSAASDRFRMWLTAKGAAPSGLGEECGVDEHARRFVTVMLDAIDHERLSSLSGVHGYALTIRRVIEDSAVAVGHGASTTHSAATAWGRTSARMYDAAFAVMGSAIATLSDNACGGGGEGAGARGGTTSDGDDANSQQWLCLKECAGLITAMTVRNRPSICRSNGRAMECTRAPLLSRVQLENAGAQLLEFLLATKHNGALAAVARCLQTVSSALLCEHGHEATEQAPQAWMRWLLSHARFSDPQFIVRRGAGFADGFLAVVRSESGASARRPMLIEVRTALLHYSTRLSRYSPQSVSRASVPPSPMRCNSSAS